MGWRVGVTSGCSKYGISHIEQQRKVIYINNLIIFIVFIIFHNVARYTYCPLGYHTVPIINSKNKEYSFV